MINFLHQKKLSVFRHLTSSVLAAVFLLTSVLPAARAQEILLPIPGTRVSASPAYLPLMLKGVEVDPQKPFNFNFFVDTGDSHLTGDELQKETNNLIKYFLASLTIPEEDLWVNLSPYEKDRIIPNQFGKTEMGRDLLSEDYMLKQLASSLTYPESDLGKSFWAKVKKQVKEKYGLNEIPLDTFNKVWIIPQDPVIYQKGTQAFVVQSRLKVMLEKDYLSSVLKNKSTADSEAANVTTAIVRDVILPAIEKEVNEGKNFARLRQIQNALLLAVWYKKVLKNSILYRFYADQNKTKGIDLNDPKVNQQIYDQYLIGLKKGVYNYIKEEMDQETKEPIPRKYFSGGYSTKNQAGQSLEESVRIVHSLTAIPADARADLVNDFVRLDNGKSTVFVAGVKFSGDTAQNSNPQDLRISSPLLSGPSASSAVEELLTNEERETLVSRLRVVHEFAVGQAVNSAKDGRIEPEFFTITMREQRRYIAEFLEKFREQLTKNSRDRLAAFDEALSYAGKQVYSDMQIDQPQSTKHSEYSDQIKRALESLTPVLIYSPAKIVNALNETLEQYILSLPPEQRNKYTVVKHIGTANTDKPELIGGMQPVPPEKRAGSERYRFEKGLLYKLTEQARQNPDRIYVLRFEQLEALTPKIWSQFNQFLLTGEMFIPETGEKLILPDNLKIIGSITTGLKDSAFYDRFVRKVMTELSDEEFLKYLQKKFSFSEKVIQEVMRLFAANSTLDDTNNFQRSHMITFLSYLSGRVKDQKISSTDEAHRMELVEYEFTLFMAATFPKSKARMEYVPSWSFDQTENRLLIDGVELSVTGDIKQAIAQRIYRFGPAIPTDEVTKIIRKVIKEKTGLIVTKENSLALSMIARDYRYGNRVIRLLGPTGTGKTYLADKLAKLLGIPYYGEPFHKGTKQEKLLGALQPDGKGEYRLNTDTPFLRSLENGGVTALSELNAAVKDNIARFGWMLVPLARGDANFVFDQYPGLGQGDALGRTIPRHPQSMFIIDINPDYDRGELPQMLEAYTPAVWMIGENSQQELEEIAQDNLGDLSDSLKAWIAPRLASAHQLLLTKLPELSYDELYAISLRELRNASQYMAHKIREQNITAIADETTEKNIQVIMNKALALYYYLAFRNEKVQREFLASDYSQLTSQQQINDFVRYSLLETTLPTMLSLPAKQNPLQVLSQVTAGRSDVQVIKFNTNRFTDDFALRGGYVPDPQTEEAKKDATRYFKWAPGILEEAIAQAYANPDKMIILAFENYHYLPPALAVALNAVLQEREYYSPITNEKITVPSNLRFFAAVSGEVSLKISLAEQSRWVRINAQVKEAEEIPEERDPLRLKRITVGDHLIDIHSFGPQPDFVNIKPDGSTWIWDGRSNSGKVMLKGADKGITDAVFSDNGKFLVTSRARRNKLQVWDTLTGEEVDHFDVKQRDINVCNVMSVSNDGRYITVQVDNIEREYNGLDLWKRESGQATKLYRSFGAYTDLSFSPDGQFILVTSSYSGVEGEIYSIPIAAQQATLRPYVNLVGHTKRISHNAYSPSARRIVTAGEEGNSIVWDAATGSRLQTLNNKEGQMFLGSDNYVLTTHRKKTLEVWDVGDGKRLKKMVLPEEASMRFLFFDKLTGTIMIHISGNEFYIWDISDVINLSSEEAFYPITLRGHAKPLIDQAVSTNGRFIVTASEDNIAKVFWDVGIEKVEMTFDYPDTQRRESVFYSWGKQYLLSKIAISPNNQLIALAGTKVMERKTEGSIAVWNVKNGEKFLLENVSHNISNMVFTSDGHYLIGLTASPNEKDSIYIWNVLTKEIVSSLELDLMDSGVKLQLSPDNKKLIVTLVDEGARNPFSAHIYDIGPEMQLNLSGITDSMAISQNFNGDQFEAHGVQYGPMIFVNNLTTGAVIQEFKGPETENIVSIDVSSDGKYVLTVHLDGVVRVWDVNNKDKPLHVLDGGVHGFKNAIFSANGKYIVTDNQEISVTLQRLWSTQTGEQVPIFDGTTEAFQRITVTNDEKFVVTHTAGENTAKVWKLEEQPKSKKDVSVIDRLPKVDLNQYPIDRGDLGPEHPQPFSAEDLLVNIPETIAVEQRALDAMNENKIVILQGDPGGGKTDIALDIPSRLGLRSELYSASDKSHLQDFVGMLTQDANGRFVFTGKPDADGHFKIPFLDLYAHGGVLVIDEGAIGRNAQALISWLTGIARGEQELVIRVPGQEPVVIKRHKHFHVIITTNLEEQTADRERIPPEVRDIAEVITVKNDLPVSSLKLIALRFIEREIKKLGTEEEFSQGRIDDLVNFIVTRHKEMIKAVAERTSLDNPERHILTLRDMQNWIRIVLPKMRTRWTQQELERAFDLVYLKQFDEKNRDFLNKVIHRASSAAVDLVTKDEFEKRGAKLTSETIVKGDLADIFLAGLHGLLILEPGARAEKIIPEFAAQQGMKIFNFESHPRNTEMDLVGGIFPVFPGETTISGKIFTEKNGFLTRHLVPEEERGEPGEKKLLVIHNIDAQPEKVRAQLNNFLIKGYLERRDDNGRMQRYYLPAHTHIVATMSSLSQREFSSAFFNRFIKLNVPAMTVGEKGFSELMQVLMFEQGLGEGEARWIVSINKLLKDLKDGGDIWPSGKEYYFTVKDAILLGRFVKAAERDFIAQYGPQALTFEQRTRIVAQEAIRLYGNRLLQYEIDYDNFKTTILYRLFPHALIEELSGEVLLKNDEIAAISGVSLGSRGKSWGNIDPRYRLTLVPGINKTFSSVLRGWQAGKIVSLVGETSAAKTTLGVFASHLLFGRDDDPQDHYYIYSTHGESRVSDLTVQLNMTRAGTFELVDQEFLKRVQKGNQVLIVDEANMRPEVLWILNGIARGEKQITVEVPGKEPYVVNVGENIFILMTMNPENYTERGDIPIVLLENVCKLWAPINYTDDEVSRILTDLARSIEKKTIDTERLRQARVKLKNALMQMTIQDLLDVVEKGGEKAVKELVRDHRQELLDLERQIKASPDVQKKIGYIRSIARMTAPDVNVEFSLFTWWAQAMDGKTIFVPLYELVNPKRSSDAVIGLIIHEFRHKRFSTTLEEREALLKELGFSIEPQYEAVFHGLYNALEDVRIDLQPEAVYAGEAEYIQQQDREFYGQPYSEDMQARILTAAVDDPHRLFKAAMMQYGYGNYYQEHDRDPRYHWETHLPHFDQFPEPLKKAINDMTAGGENSPLYRATRAKMAILDLEGIRRGEVPNDQGQEKLRAAKESLKVILEEIFPVYLELYHSSEEYKRSQQIQTKQSGQSGQGHGEGGEKNQPSAEGQGEQGQLPTEGVPHFIVSTPEQIKEMFGDNPPEPLPGPQGGEGVPGQTPQGSESNGVGAPQFLSPQEEKQFPDIDKVIEDAKKDRQAQMQTHEPLNLTMTSVAPYGKKLGLGLIQLFSMPEDSDTQPSASGWKINPVRYARYDPLPFDIDEEEMGQPDLALGVTIDVSGSMRDYMPAMEKMLAILMNSFEQISKKKAEYSVSFVNTEFDDDIKPFGERLNFSQLNQKFGEIVHLMRRGGRGKGRGDGIATLKAVKGIIEKYKQIKKVNKVEIIFTDGEDTNRDIENGEASPALKKALQEARDLEIEIIAVGFNTEDTKIFDKYIQLDKENSEFIVEALLKIAKVKASRGKLPKGDLRKILNLSEKRLENFTVERALGLAAVNPDRQSDKASSPLNAATPGGIDLNPANFEMRIKRDKAGVPLPLNQQPLEIQNFKLDGLVPLIINITPVKNFPMLLGVAKTDIL